MEDWMRDLFDQKTSRNLACFLALNLFFAITELLYGFWANSLGLISDSFHMFFDCTALIAGLIATVISKWQANDAFTYGYVRAEIIAGFLNCIFLMFIAFFIFCEALKRIVDPQPVHNERLFIVSVGGFIVNIIGMFVFHHGHSHNEGASRDHHSILDLDSHNSDYQIPEEKKLHPTSSDHKHSLIDHSHKSINQTSSDHKHSLISRGSSHRNLSQAPSDHIQSQTDNYHSHSAESVHQQSLSVSSVHYQTLTDDSVHCQTLPDDSVHRQTPSDDSVDHHYLNIGTRSHYSRISHRYNSQTNTVYSVRTTPSQARIMQGVFLHILADTLGSVGVMVSSLLISEFGWMIFDPLCSLVISVLILMSIFPMLQESLSILMQRTPHSIEMLLPVCYNMVKSLKGVHNIGETHFWTVCTNEYVGTINLEVDKNADSHYILQETHDIFYQVGVNHLHVQIDFEVE